MNGYDLSRNFWDFTFENPDKIKVHHIAIYFFAVEHCNRLGWKKKFGFPTSMVLDAVGLKSYSSYKRYFDELVEWGMFKVHEYSKNQFSSNIIELTLNAKADSKALDKATSKHASKHFESTEQSTSQSIGSIDKPITLEHKTIKPLNGTIPPLSEFLFYAKEKCLAYEYNFETLKPTIMAKYDSWVENGWCVQKDKKMVPILKWKSTLGNTLPFLNLNHGKQNNSPTKKKFVAPDYSHLVEKIG